jgi:hypothetical protein
MSELGREDSHLRSAEAPRGLDLETVVTSLLNRLDDKFGHRGDDLMALAYAAVIEEATVRYRRHAPSPMLDVLLLRRMAESMSAAAADD